MEHHISVARTARYQQLGEISAATRQLWLVVHGYGQLAEYFIRHFTPLHAADPLGTVIVAPEALSRFYLTGTAGRVGASWMTRADRLAEIEDQDTYLTHLLANALAGCPASTRVTVLAFSQGTATVSRWLARHANRWRPQQLVLWAGDFPADIEAEKARQLLQQLSVALVSGDQDAYVSAATLQQQAALVGQHGATVTTLSFSGGHTLNASLLQQLHTQAMG
ncbi:phospholipase [Hymenobacter sp. HMF4947]|uniref:Phospholipase n=1 Tax=Hymenobacter ginkgonis TaxID=2682976 RepID=A0A7K1TAT1_9BACT|nr:phospholipase [Hymenobacter ginkgonis]MVN75516.1 phospholipase [Hymenobacter ginkgonis]